MIKFCHRPCESIQVSTRAKLFGPGPTRSTPATPLSSSYIYTLAPIIIIIIIIGIKQQYQKFHDLGAVDLHIEIEEVGPMGGDNNMAYDRGYVQVLNAQHNIMINGK